MPDPAEDEAQRAEGAPSARRDHDGDGHHDGDGERIGGEPRGEAPGAGDAAEPPDTSDAPDKRSARAERRRAERREAILAAAKAVFRQKGYHQAGVHDIIDEARIARGTFYLYFASKQEVFGHLVDDFLRLIRGQVRRITVTPDADPPLLQLRDNFRRVVTTVLEHDDVASIILRDPTSFDVESRARVRRFMDQVLALVEDALNVGRRLGLTGQCDVAIVAVTALGGVRAALICMLDAHHGNEDLASGASRSEAFRDPERVADSLLDFCLRGLGGTLP